MRSDSPLTKVTYLFHLQHYTDAGRDCRTRLARAYSPTREREHLQPYPVDPYPSAMLNVMTIQTYIPARDHFVPVPPSISPFFNRIVMQIQRSHYLLALLQHCHCLLYTAHAANEAAVVERWWRKVFCFCLDGQLQ